MRQSTWNRARQDTSAQGTSAVVLADGGGGVCRCVLWMHTKRSDSTLTVPQFPIWEARRMSVLLKQV